MPVAIAFPSRIDVEWCVAALGLVSAQPGSVLTGSAATCRSLLSSDAVTLVQVDDEASGRPVACAAALVLADDDRVGAVLQPGTSIFDRAWRAEADWQPLILRARGARAVNHPGHGVTIVIACGADQQREPPARAWHRLWSELLARLSGYYVREVVVESRSAQAIDHALHLGAVLTSSHGWPARPNGCSQPLVARASRDTPGTGGRRAFMPLFDYEAPCLFFTDGQQRVLRRAVRVPTPTDPEIAAELNVERSTLRDHWRAIFARVAAAQARGTLPVPSLPPFATASPLLRPAIVAFVHEHRCELRPAEPELVRRGLRASAPIQGHLPETLASETRLQLV